VNVENSSEITPITLLLVSRIEPGGHSIFILICDNLVYLQNIFDPPRLPANHLLIGYAPDSEKA
jgi:hypothetical protein